MKMKDKKKTIKYLQGYDSISAIEKVYDDLEVYCKKYNIAFISAHAQLGKAISAQARSATGEEHFLEYWAYLLHTRTSYKLAAV